MYLCDKLSDDETKEQADKREHELIERKFMEWLDFIEIRKFQKYKEFVVQSFMMMNNIIFGDFIIF